MSELADVQIADLLDEVNRRNPDEMFTDKGFIIDPAYKLADTLGIRVCVDGAPVRLNEDNEPELMAIERQTGPYAGRLCLIGGGVGRFKENGVWLPESIGEAAQRHFKRDLGMSIIPVTSWEEPQQFAQDMRPINGEVRPGFYPNPDSRHLVAARYLVRITDGAENPVFGTTEHGGQEAEGVVWFDRDNMPDDEAFGYNHGDTYRKMFDAAEDLDLANLLAAETSKQAVR